ncbi:hypothetical protein PIB30_069770 [Stylosanthes scabra]|uniref:Uncharacterized protein n=1 Tax=Stylosanthes scabra TaxID=79078 RepID=A0ABU6XMZ5_9FABA|nr:hypothetical protein [Stylosanthes scabra]
MWDSQRVVVVCARMEWVYAWTCPMWSARRSDGKGVSTHMRRAVWWEVRHDGHAYAYCGTHMHGWLREMMAMGDEGHAYAWRACICIGSVALVEKDGWAGWGMMWHA